MSRNALATEADEGSVHTLSDLDAELARFSLQDSPHGSTLTAQELYVLEKAGYEVCNVVIGNIVYSMGARGVVNSIKRSFSRGEMVDFTRMKRDARELARNRMLSEAKAIGATAVVDVQFETQEYADFIEITAIGTAVRKMGAAATDAPDIVVGQG